MSKIRPHQSYKVNIYRGEAGVFVAFSILAMAFVLSLIAMVVGIGMLTNDKVIFQDSANLAALAGLKAFMGELPDSADKSDEFEARKKYSRNQAIRFLKENKLPGIVGSWDNFVQLDYDADGGPGGRIYFGEWLREEGKLKNESSVICPGGKYPCFIDRTNAVAEELQKRINAVRIQTKNPAENPFMAPLARMVGNKGFYIRTNATASIVHRCLAFLMDLSVSSQAENFVYVNPNVIQQRADSFGVPEPNSKKGEIPAGWGYFAITRDDLEPNIIPDIDQGQEGGGDSVLPNVHCGPHPFEGISNIYYKNLPLRFWCFMQRYQPVRNTNDPKMHFLDDYKHHTMPGDTMYGKDVWISDFISTTQQNYGAEPLSRFFLAMNYTLKTLAERGYGADKAVVLGMRGTGSLRLDRFPASGLTSNFELLLQLTNILNRGTNDFDTGQTSPERFPNFVNKGWFPVYSEEGTDLTSALTEAASALGECPASSQKSIILATDGVATCRRWAANGTANVKCSPMREVNLEAEYEIIEKVLPILKTNNIALTVMLDGKHVQPNFLNVKDPEGNYIDLSRALSYGYGGLKVDDQDQTIPIFNGDPTANLCQSPKTPGKCFFSTLVGDVKVKHKNSSDEDFSYDLMGEDFIDNNKNNADVTIVYRRPNLLWGAMALHSGGVPCPLMPKCKDGGFYNGYFGETYREIVLQCGGVGGESTSCYDSQNYLLDYVRSQFTAAGMPQLCSVTDSTKGEQASLCIMNTLGHNPYVLVQEEQ